MSRTTGLSAGDVVLGLVIEQPDRGFDLERRLEDRFGSAQFVYSTAFNALYRMEKRGLVRIVGAGSMPTRRATYEATPEGAEHFRRWLRAPTSPPLLREELHAKVALCEPRDLPRLIEIVHVEELACIGQLNRIRERIAVEQRGRVGRALAEERWSDLMDRGVVHGEAAFWGGRIAHLGQLRLYLEELRGEAERRALADHRRGVEAQRRAG
jgi:DNA-binding PadR family transcriptional regulator